MTQTREVYLIRHNNSTISALNYFDALNVAVSIVKAHRDDKAIIYWTHELFPNDEPSIWECIDSSNINEFERIVENHRLAN